MTKQLLKCGCYPNSKTGPNLDIDSCVIHCCQEKAEVDPDEIVKVLASREATCSYCQKRVSSSMFHSLAFFSHRAHHQYDEYYCGCRGWD